jgi:spore coat polysaccharide biosynthesis protein SpsF
MAVTAAIVQARLSSTRLPGKVLMPLGRMTVLAQCLARIGKVPGVDVVCVATVPGRDGALIAAEARACGAEVFVGSETDVLARYAGAATKLGADIVLRITSDCPFADPHLAGQVLDLLAAENADISTNNVPPSFPHGVDCEAFTTPWLLRAEREGHEPHDREHVSGFIRTHPGARRVSLVAQICDPYATSLRWTVDRPEDLAFARAAQNLLENCRIGEETRYEILADLLRKRPDIVALNAMWAEPRSTAPPAGFRTVVRPPQIASRTRPSG